MKSKYFLIMIIVFVLFTSCRADNEIARQSLATSSSTSSVTTEDSSSSGEEASSSQPGPTSITQAGETLVTYVDSKGIGKIAIQVTLPETPRYSEGAGVVIEVSTFLTPANRFNTNLDAPAIGLIHVSYLWPGISDRDAASEGKFDYGGKDSIQALRDVIRFVSGEVPNSEGYTLDELVAFQPLYNNVGIYAFSHPGQAAVNVLGLHGDQLSQVGYFVGRENPTMDKLTAVEVGYFNQKNRPELNPLYQYPADYSPKGISLEYSSILWDADYTEPGANWIGVPYFDFNGNGKLDGSDHRLALRVPAVNGKRVYSVELIKALRNNNAFSDSGWPDDVASLELAKQTWIFLDSTRRYLEIGQKLPDLNVMIVFARFDHVQPAADKPHIHHAYDGFSGGAKLWVRLNPDQAYVSWVSSQAGNGYTDHPANQEPDDWLDIEDWGYSNRSGASQLVPLAAVAEMSDRTQANNWENDLDATLYDYNFSEGN
jgi:hypothetical protein